MSEIKHNFTGGKMNKDFDERLVPNGEYRDAVNIQVSTSEGSDVGTVQNILGNELGCDANMTSAGSVTVGSIADENNDSLYWLVSGPSLEGVSLANLFSSASFTNEISNNNPYYLKDMIMRKTSASASAPGICEPVLVDKHGGIFPNYDATSNNLSNTSDSNTLILSDNEFLDHVYAGMTVFGANIDGSALTSTQTVTNVGNIYDISTPYSTTSSPGPLTQVAIHSSGNSLVSSEGVATWVSTGGGGSYQQAADVIFVSNAFAVPSGIQIGDIISFNLINTEIIGLLGSGNSSNSQNGAFFQIDQGVLPFASGNPNEEVRDLNGESLGSNGVLYNVDIYDDPVVFTIHRPTSVFTNQIYLPVNSPWLNEISDLFWNTTDPNSIYELSTVGDDILEFSPSPTWPNGGCIAQPPAPTFLNGALTYNTNSLYVVDCNSAAAILPTSASPHALNLFVVGNNAFSGSVVTLDNNLDLTGGYEYLVFASERVLNFSPTKMIKGINIIDDMLFWVDGKEGGNGSVVGTEPKKINIKRSVAGTIDIDHHTMLINDDTSVIGPPLKEEHITVIRTAPKTPLTFDIVTDRLLDKNYSGIINICSPDGPNESSFISTSQNRRDFNGLDKGDVIRVSIPTDMDSNEEFELPWKLGTRVVLQEFAEDGLPPTIPFAGNEYRIMGVIDKWKTSSGTGNKMNGTTGNPAQVEIEITSIVGFPPQTQISSTNTSGVLSYAIDTYFDTEKLFEFKFPRFSYRYKYRDGEVSTYAPFTSVVFAPSNFVYHPTRGFNLGMVSALTGVDIKDFVTQDIPEDVVAIDILYKEDASPNVYIVDTVKPNDQVMPGSAFNNWDSNTYEITSDTIHSVVASNQLLRQWDNVPRKALAQEVTGNRIVYGNYVQNYNLTIGSQDFTPKFSHYLSKSNSAPLTRSIKSLRDYQLGVVFTDKYGRETPVIANSTGAFKVPKSRADESNALTIELDGQGPPNDLQYFKFFIKETSGEYYNLAMDRFFDADDGNYWLSFPSSDRNKIDEDTFLILKKGQDSKQLVGDKARYKVLAIENEAPDFIKTSQYNIAEVKQENDDLFASLVDAPTETKDYFHILSGKLNAGSASDLDDIEDPLYVEFGSASSTKVSNRYRITEVTKTDPFFAVKIDGQFGNDVNLISDGTKIIAGAVVRFYKYQVENKPIFDGRFFVKILNDDVFERSIAVEDIGEKEYVVSAEKKIFFMSSDHMQRHHHDTLTTLGATFGDDSSINDIMVESASALTFDQLTATSSTLTSGNYPAYEAYFKNKFYSDGTSNINYKTGSLHTKHRGVGLEDGDYTGEKYFEDVMFIDHGHNSGNHGHSGAFRFGLLNNDKASQGIGIVNYPNSSKGDIGRMDLSFGSLEPEENSRIKYKDTLYHYTDSWEWKDGEDGADFWNLTSPDRSKYNSQLAPIYNKIQSGQQFRWKEDPSQTIYTIYSQVDNYNTVRFDNTTKREWINALEEVGGDEAQFPYYRKRDSSGELATNHNGTPYTLSSNFQQKKRFWFKPSMTNWDPTKQDNLGVITGGAYVDKYISDLTDPLNNQEPIIIGSVMANNKLRVGFDAVHNSYDTLNDVGFALDGMILTHVDGDLLATPVLVDKIVDINGVLSSIQFKGYQGTSGEIFPPPSIGDALIFQQPSMNGLSVNSANNINDENPAQHGIGAIGYTMEFIELKDEKNELSLNPAIWETEPKESTDLDIYYEISGNNPINLNTSTIKTVLPIGSKVYSSSGGGSEELFITSNNYPGGNTIMLSERLCAEASGCVDSDGAQVAGVVPTTYFRVQRPNGTNIKVEVDEVLEIQTLGTDLSRVFKLKTSLYNTAYTLDWHNCYAFGNGVESNRIRDGFNLPFIANGVKASTTFEDNYKEEWRKYGLIYSGIYNSNSGVNNLNQFIVAEKITKDINPIYGSIQKLHSRSTADGDLIVLCEDRVLKILAEKDALFNADGNPQLIATNKVLGQATPFSGEFGISKNPESFASESYRVYFTDKVRGSVMRLSKDGLTVISDHGMKDWFRDNLKLSTKLIGSYDDRNDEYNITLDSVADVVSYPNGRTVTFKEDVKGWVSFKSFTPENAISCANEYYTFNQGTLWKHYSETEDRNTFYKVFPVDGEGFTPSSINVIINESPSTIKTFHTLNYEGTQSKVNTFTNYADSNGNVYNNEYYNLEPKDGWKVQSIITDQEEGSINEFIEKEGKWFNYIRGKAGSVTDGVNITSGFDNADFAFQGLGTLSQAATASNSTGCTANGLDENGAGVVNDYFGDGIPAFNYNEFAMVPLNNTCIQTVSGCDDPLAGGYNATVNVNDGSCLYYGCMDSLAINYDSTANSDDGSCTYYVFGCMDGATDVYNNPIMSNFSSIYTAACNGVDGNYPNFTAVTCADGVSNGDNCCCVPFVYGCMDPLADNYGDGISYPLANVQATSSDDSTNPCFTTILGCMDSTSCVYNNNANTDDGSCNWCNNPTANNYDGVDDDAPYLCDSGCLFCKPVANLQQILGGGNQDTTIDLQWDETWDGNAAVEYYEVTYSDGTTSNTISNIQPNSPTQGTVSYGIASLSPGVQYTITVEAFCQAGTSPLNLTYSTSSGSSAAIQITTSVALVGGCIDSDACNYNELADYNNGTCEYASCVGCMDPMALNYDANVTNDDGSCTYVYGCMQETALNYDPLATYNDGSCIYPVNGCMDDSQNNAGTGSAAWNYDDTATADDGSCQYYPITQWAFNSPDANSQLLSATNQFGWKSTGLWGGQTYRRIFAIWDVSLAPKIANQSPEMAWHNSFVTGNSNNTIDNYNYSSPVYWSYSVDDGQNWLNGSNWNGTDAIQLIYLVQDVSGLVPFVNNESEYPPISSDGVQEQKGRFTFANSDLLPQETPVAGFNVYLGCNDDSIDLSTGFQYLNYNDPIPFFDNSNCNSDAFVNEYGSVNNVDATIATNFYAGDTGIYHLTHYLSWNYAIENGNTDPNEYEFSYGFTAADGVDAVNNFTTVDIQISFYYAVGDTLLINTQRSTNPTGNWYHYRVRLKKLDGTYGPYISTWAQIPSEGQ